MDGKHPVQNVLGNKGVKMMKKLSVKEIKQVNGGDFFKDLGNIAGQTIGIPKRAIKKGVDYVTGN
ncbi:hypothetical protein [Staphylococcus auricularis]|uniref:Bacteriocin n=1 Tax=Staphylococcus auricularis TaxID=29379 RepID=A0ABX5IGI9_9STAP|nr:hypothetical protein [Staphylococcus auricularis]MCE5038951.1 hypothetical protein [Staphylococcus auricularis]MEB6570753.1 hypothetical protein [Staphylococcus auricularis]PTH18525.1 hypothetical protein BU607_04650 [Staphylococcus auricularis]PTH25474.1 hypothetical protein BU608_07450 [Staphylococcus auricularis]